MTNYMCQACGVQFEASENPPEICPICSDDRQFVPWDGQKWTTLATLQKNHANQIQKVEKGIYTLQTTPGFAIGQRTIFIQTEQGNILWDCISLIDETTVELLNHLGGVDAIAISHPHYYSTMAEWSNAFNNAPIYLHKKDADFVLQKSENIVFWEGNSLELWENIQLINPGGHFPGATVLHQYDPEKDAYSLFTGDIINVEPDMKTLSFMYSYPNHIPLSAKDIEIIRDRMEGIPFERIFGAWYKRNIMKDGRALFDASLERYLKIVRPN